MVRKGTGMKEIMTYLSQPKYAAGIAAIIGIFAKWLDHRLSDTKGTFGGYLKIAIYSAAVVGLWTWLLGNPEKTRDLARQLTPQRYSDYSPLPVAPAMPSYGEPAVPSSRYFGGGGGGYNRYSGGGGSSGYSSYNRFN